MRLIDADKTIETLEEARKEIAADEIFGLFSDEIDDGLVEAIRIVKHMPTVEERQHGHWIETNEYYTGAYESLYYYKCSVCGELILEDVDFGVGNYCQQCGATMDEEVKADE